MVRWSTVRRFAVFLVLFGGLFAGGCATVQPWERENLARPDMTFDANAHLGAAEAHAADTREGSSGGFGGGGGGCGCN
ncbi:MAG: DUF4266 domain-containing protein [Myxococcota bacterium]